MRCFYKIFFDFVFVSLILMNPTMDGWMNGLELWSVSYTYNPLELFVEHLPMEGFHRPCHLATPVWL